MPIAPVDGKGTVLYYEDTGALKGPYLTTVFVHAVGFHLGIFRRLLPLATKHHMRFVCINRRDYPGSTPLTDDDVADINSLDDARRAEFYRRQAVEIAEFLAWFARTEDIPPYATLEDGSVQGGLALVGWSFGTMYYLDMLAYPERIPEGTRATLEPYLRNVCAIDAPHHLWGVKDPPNRTFYHPLTDTELGRIEQYGAFAVWISSYYAHEDVHSGDPALLTDITGALENPPPSLVVMSPEDQVAISHPKPTFRWEKDRITIPYDGQWTRTERIMDKSTQHVWPRCRFTVLWGDRSIWEPVYGAWKVKELVEEKKKDGTAGREVRIMELAGANHFVIWDMPERVIETLASCL